MGRSLRIGLERRITRTIVAIALTVARSIFALTLTSHSPVLARLVSITRLMTVFSMSCPLAGELVE